MNFLINYWYFLVAAIAVIVIAFVVIYKFVIMPSDSKISKIKEWLLYAVTEAEKKLGSGTGQIKLRYVYELFMNQFPWVAKVVSFSFFSDLVDEVLEKFRTLLSSNKNLQDYVDDTVTQHDA